MKQSNFQTSVDEYISTCLWIQRTIFQLNGLYIVESEQLGEVSLWECYSTSVHSLFYFLTCAAALRCYVLVDQSQGTENAKVCLYPRLHLLDGNVLCISHHDPKKGVFCNSSVCLGRRVKSTDARLQSDGWWLHTDWWELMLGSDIWIEFLCSPFNTGFVQIIHKWNNLKGWGLCVACW